MARTSHGGLAVFVKTPELSAVKTRLAADIGEAAAKQHYENMLKRTAAMMRKVEARGMAVYWAVGEKEGVTHKRWREFDAIHTGEGDLGARLHCVYETMRMRHGCAVLVGSDCPQLSADIVMQGVAFANRDEMPSPIVVGPAVDGGFYLFASRRDIPAQAWHDVAYSCEDTLANLLININATNTALRLPVLQDVDDKHSLQANLMGEDSLT